MTPEEDRKTKITIVCKDGTTRIITCIGIRDIGFATQLGKDLEDTNFKYALISIL